MMYVSVATPYTLAIQAVAAANDNSFLMDLLHRVTLIKEIIE
jgi:hypothetical protein